MTGPFGLNPLSSGGFCEVISEGSRASNKTINALPKELLAKVFYLLDSNSVASCRSVCRKWSNNTEDVLMDIRIEEILGEILNMAREEANNITKRNERFKLLESIAKETLLSKDIQALKKVTK